MYMLYVDVLYISFKTEHLKTNINIIQQKFTIQYEYTAFIKTPNRKIVLLSDGPYIHVIVNFI